MRSTLLMALSFCLLAAESSFLLPHQNADARHALVEAIKAADGDLLVISDTLEEAVLQRAMRKALDKPRTISLMTTQATTAASWALFRNVQACLLPASDGHPIGFTLIGDPSATLCLLTAPADETVFRCRSALMHCTAAETFRPIIHTLKEECTPYLK